MLAQRLHVAVQQPLDSLAETRDADGIVAADLVLVGHRRRLGGYLRNRARAPFLHRRQAVFDARTDVQHTRAQRAQQALVAGEGNEVGAELLHVDRHVTGRLRGVDHAGNLRLPGDAGDLVDRLHRARDVRDVHAGDQARLGTNRLADVVGVDQAGLPVARNELHVEPDLFGQGVVRTEHRIVLHGGGNRVGPGRRGVQQPANGDHQRLGAIQREDDPLGRLGVDQRCDPPAAFGQHPFAVAGFLIRTPPGRRTNVAREVHHRLGHHGGLGKAGS